MKECSQQREAAERKKIKERARAIQKTKAKQSFLGICSCSVVQHMHMNNIKIQRYKKKKYMILEKKQTEAVLGDSSFVSLSLSLHIHHLASFCTIAHFHLFSYLVIVLQPISITTDNKPATSGYVKC